ncbi:chorion peroxidase-like isoform X2 [Daphnia pulicaria]|uniref:chorion peroxidase-like isoform X2 n=1 Tax=Daphnia pulicaria TaxID=35523 RepID=UPI001EEC464D|nr:chorion peroxidase-like isoform X2 [Daphnia pulicaria]
MTDCSNKWFVALFLASCLCPLLEVDGRGAASYGEGANEEVTFTEEEFQEALRIGQEYVTKWEQLEDQILEVDRNRSEHHGTSRVDEKYHSRRFNPQRYNPEAIAQSKEAAVYLVARQYLSDKLGIPAEKIGDFERSSTFGSDVSDRQICDFNSKFRTFDGTCNNVGVPSFGKSGTIFNRLVSTPSEGYDDGVATIRRSKLTRSPLPSARLVSTTVLNNKSFSRLDVSLLTMQWGQFLDHDLTSTPTFTKSDGSAFLCCSAQQTGVNVAPPHPECLPIAIPRNDPVFNPLGNGQVTCMNFIRSTFGNNLDGTFPRMRSQINALTHWIDGSNVYGSSAAKARSLRDPTSGRGRMRTFISNLGRQMLPLGTCPVTCFDAGDSRVNEQPLLSVMHTIWLREHNRIAENLFRIVPGQTDEFYFQHARRIVIAEMQHIIYNEYLPVIIGPTMAAKVNSESGYSNTLNPAVFTEFSTAAFRMGHSQLRSFIRLFERDGSDSRESYQLSDSFDDSSRLFGANFMDNALRGLLQVPAEEVDSFFAFDITSQLFKPKGATVGLDLTAFNIQRGRDHGLPTYAKMLAFLGQPVPSTFDQLLSYIPIEVVNAMKFVYESVYDIDLFIGGVTEYPMPDAVLGPTFANIFAYQFSNLRRSDRFFYKFNVDQPTGFRSGQLAEIQKVSLARIICDNSDGTVGYIQPKAFRTPHDSYNRLVPCSNIPGIDFFKMLPL